MKKRFSYPFYHSLRFRFGLIFGLLFLFFLLGIVFFLYSNVKYQLEKSFADRLKSQANIVLQKTEISPLTIPLPQEKEYFLLTYNNGKQSDTLFNNLPLSAKLLSAQNPRVQLWRALYVSRILETGGIINIWYALSANELNKNLEQLRLVLFIYIPLSLFISFIAGYFLSGFLLQPIHHIISKANDTSLQNEIQLLKEPKTKDELHHLSVALNRMLERIQKQSQQQNAFFASASHELRTPLSVMLTELQVLQMSNTSLEIKSILQNQIAAVQRLNKLVNDFLLMSQLKSGTLMLQKENVNIVELVTDSSERLMNKMQQQFLSLKINLLPVDGNFDVWADAALLQIIIFNLMENAAKYAKAQTLIEITIKQIDKNILFNISNTTDKEIINIEKLTDEFKREDDYKEGFGLGLWIVKQLIVLHDAKFNLLYINRTFMAEWIMKKK
ncbi:MAG: HAMP domain-containing sensor histidine kinase [Chitinophagaceae bacterium]